MKKKSRHSKNIILSLVMVMTLFVSVCSFSFESNAANVFYVNYAQPSTSDTQGFVCLKIVNDSTGAESVNTFFWSTQANWYDSLKDSSSGNYVDQNYQEVPVVMSLTISDTKIRFMPQCEHFSYSYCNISNYTSSGALRIRFKGSFLTGGSDPGYNTGYMPYYYDFGAEGYTIKNVYYSGNIGDVTLSYNLQYQSGGFEVVFNKNASAVQLQSIIDLLTSSNDISSDILDTVTSILSSVDGVEEQLNSIKSYLSSVSNKLSAIQSQLNSILAEEKTQNTWLEKIWISIQEFISPSNEDEEITDKFEEENKEQSNTMNDLNEQNKTDKVDIDSASGAVDSYIDENAILNYGQLLRIFTEHEYILKCMLVVLAVALVSYVLFGKKR